MNVSERSHTIDISELRIFDFEDGTVFQAKAWHGAPLHNYRIRSVAAKRTNKVVQTVASADPNKVLEVETTYLGGLEDAEWRYTVTCDRITKAGKVSKVGRAQYSTSWYGNTSAGYPPTLEVPDVFEALETVKAIVEGGPS